MKLGDEDLDQILFFLLKFFFINFSAGIAFLQDIEGGLFRFYCF